MKKLTLQTARIKSGLTMQEVADAVGITKASISYYESLKRFPRYDIAIKIIQFYRKLGLILNMEELLKLFLSKRISYKA